MSLGVPVEPPHAAPESDEAPLLEPRILRRIEHLRVMARRLLRGHEQGDRRARRRGFSVEFADYREYVPGDDLRFIDWSVLGRLDRLFIKLYQEEEDLDLHVIIDTSLSMGFGRPSKLALAQRIAAALGYVALVGLDRVSLAALAEKEVERLDPQRGRKQMWRLLEFLAKLRPQGGTSLAAAIERYFAMRPARGVAVVISDFLDPAGFEPVLKQLVRGNLEAYAIQVLAPEEITPTLSGDLRLVDVEDQSVVDVTLDEDVLARYHAELTSFIGQVQRFATDRGIRYVFAASDARFEEVVLTTLRSSGLLR